MKIYKKDGNYYLGFGFGLLAPFIIKSIFKGIEIQDEILFAGFLAIFIGFYMLFKGE